MYPVFCTPHPPWNIWVPAAGAIQFAWLTLEGQFQKENEAGTKPKRSSNRPVHYDFRHGPSTSTAENIRCSRPIVLSFIGTYPCLQACDCFWPSITASVPNITYRTWNSHIEPSWLVLAISPVGGKGAAKIEPSMQARSQQRRWAPSWVPRLIDGQQTTLSQTIFTGLLGGSHAAYSFLVSQPPISAQ